VTKKKEDVVAQEVVIKNVVVKIGEREIVLTIEEAKKLKDALEGIFGKEIIKETKIIHERDWYEQPYVWPWPKYPKVTWDQIPEWHDKPYYEVTCGDPPGGWGATSGGAGSAIGGKPYNKANTMFLSIKN
jgi:hypothetical protein